MGGSNKDLAEALRAFAGKLKSRTTAAIIVAGGSSTRMGGNTPKQFLDLCGIPVAVHTMRAYEESEYIDQIYIVAREEDVKNGVYDNYAEKFSITKYRTTVSGGKTRQESVLKGIEALTDATPLSRIGKPSEVAAAALFLAGDGASFITGDVLNISGGFVI